MSALITHHKNVYQVLFFNEETKENKPLGTFRTEDEAILATNKYEIDFYKTRTNLLPKGVSIGNNSFQLIILCYTISGRKKNTLIASSKTLSEMKKLKMKCLSSIIG